MTSNRGNTETSVPLLTSKNCNGENPFMRNEFFVNLALGAAPIQYKKQIGCLQIFLTDISVTHLCIKNDGINLLKTSEFRKCLNSIYSLCRRDVFFTKA